MHLFLPCFERASTRNLPAPVHKPCGAEQSSKEKEPVSGCRNGKPERQTKRMKAVQRHGDHCAGLNPFDKKFPLFA